MKVTINVRPVRSSWGGGNQWASQLVRFLRGQRHDVCFRLDRSVDVILLAASRRFPGVTFDVTEARRFLARHPNARCFHRINDSGRHPRAGVNVDACLAEANRLADYTVFISRWVRDYHAASWFDVSRPHAVILNEADPLVFHPRGSVAWDSGEPLRLVTHHWSDHWEKGFAVYEAIDHMMAEGRLPDTELWVIGRWPRDIRWKAAKTFSPRNGHRLAKLLRRCHVYVTASRWEAGGMHVVEGLQCGLPALYHADGGGVVEAAEPFGIAYHGEIHSAILQMRAGYPDLRRRLLEAGPSGTTMCAAYGRLLEAVAATHRAGSHAVALLEHPA